MKTQSFLFIFLIASFLFISKSFSQNIYKKLSVSACDSLINGNELNPDFVILDVRTHGEWVGDHLQGAINRSTNDLDFEQQLDKLPRHKVYLIHCKSGGRSAGAFLKMQALNFSEVYEMVGGINAWKNEGYTTTSEQKPRLMLVSYTDSLNTSDESDTIRITVTNRANDTLIFSSAMFTDFHDLSNNFDRNMKLLGAEDYTFSIIHVPGYDENETTTVSIESNGGTLELDIVYKNGLIQNSKPEKSGRLNIFPNPANNQLFINNSTYRIFDEIILFDIYGSIVLQKNNLLLPTQSHTSDLKNGIYIIQLKGRNKILFERIIIQH